MEFGILYKGLILGFSVAAPVGPIGILCINRTINKGYLSGFISGLGAATADVIYGLIAGLGITVISDFLIDHKIWFQAIGLVLLFYIGIRIIGKREVDLEISKDVEPTLVKDYISTFILTLTNPIAIFFFLAVFAGMGLTTCNKITIWFLLLGLFVGSAIWWFFLSMVSHKIKNKLSGKTLKRIDIVSGTAIIGIAIFMLINLIKELL
jgi:Putative threonine efflux protein